MKRTKQCLTRTDSLRPEERYRKQQSRYGRTTTDQRGNFSIRGLRPGTYTLFTWETLDGDTISIRSI